MEVQVIRPPGTDRPMWLVLDDAALPIAPLTAFLRYLDHRERSPNTIRAYAHHLMLFWTFLRDARLAWTTVGLTELADFVAWLRQPRSGIVTRAAQEARRTAATINAILAAVATFYEFQARLGAVTAPPFTEQRRVGPRPYKPFLHHVAKRRTVASSRLALKAPHRFPKTLTADQVAGLLAACHRARDRFLVSLLYETGMRIGQALGLRHADIVSWDNQIRIVPRDNANGARAKTRDPFVVDVPPALMAAYVRYLLDEFGELDSDYVFVNLWEGTIGAPLAYPTVVALFQRLSAATGCYARPHLLRHTHATELVRAGWDLAFVQRRLGHSDIQTTGNTYVHLTQGDLATAYRAYLARREEGQP